MTKIVLDPATQSKLETGGQILEICDPSGRILGHFLPVSPSSPANPLEPQISDEEIQARLRQGGGRPLADILADLEKRA